VVAEGCADKIAIPIPESIRQLYELKIGKSFEIRSKELDGNLFINLVTSLED
jgi:hypothetical protein